MTDDQIDALDTFALHAMAPRGRQSVRDFARAVLAAASEAAKPVGWMSPIEFKNLGIAHERNDNRGFIIRPSQLPDCIPTVPLYASRAPTDSQAGRDAVEARRYRALREALDAEELPTGLHEAFQMGGEALDAAIDALSTPTGKAAE